MSDFRQAPMRQDQDQVAIHRLLPGELEPQAPDQRVNMSACPPISPVRETATNKYGASSNETMGAPSRNRGIHSVCDSRADAGLRIDTTDIRGRALTSVRHETLVASDP
jgi:hypothetical protein